MKGKYRRPLALIGLILMGILAAGAIILAVIGAEWALRLLMADLFCLMIIPAIIYGYQIFFTMINRKNQGSEAKDPPHTTKD